MATPRDTPTPTALSGDAPRAVGRFASGSEAAGAGFEMAGEALRQVAAYVGERRKIADTAADALASTDKLASLQQAQIEFAKGLDPRAPDYQEQIRRNADTLAEQALRETPLAQRESRDRLQLRLTEWRGRQSLAALETREAAIQKDARDKASQVAELGVNEIRRNPGSLPLVLARIEADTAPLLATLNAADREAAVRDLRVAAFAEQVRGFATRGDAASAKAALAEAEKQGLPSRVARSLADEIETRVRTQQAEGRRVAAERRDNIVTQAIRGEYTIEQLERDLQRGVFSGSRDYGVVLGIIQQREAARARGSQDLLNGLGAVARGESPTQAQANAVFTQQLAANERRLAQQTEVDAGPGGAPPALSPQQRQQAAFDAGRSLLAANAPAPEPYRNQLLALGNSGEPADLAAAASELARVRADAPAAYADLAKLVPQAAAALNLARAQAGGLEPTPQAAAVAAQRIATVRPEDIEARGRLVAEGMRDTKSDMFARVGASINRAASAIPNSSPVDVRTRHMEAFEATFRATGDQAVSLRAAEAAVKAAFPVSRVGGAEHAVPRGGLSFEQALPAALREAGGALLTTAVTHHVETRIKELSPGWSPNTSGGQPSFRLIASREQVGGRPAFTVEARTASGDFVLLLDAASKPVMLAVPRTLEQAEKDFPTFRSLRNVQRDTLRSTTGVRESRLSDDEFQRRSQEGGFGMPVMP